MPTAMAIDARDSRRPPRWSGMSELSVLPIDDAPVDLTLPREEAEALLLAVDALRPLLERLRAEIAPEPEPAPDAEATAALTLAPDHDDALRRATWLARESLREARTAIGERAITADQRRAWQEAARRYVAATRRSVVSRQR
jgi:hypothetical protein